MTAKIRSLLLDRSILLQVGAVLVICQLLAHLLTISFMLWRFERPDLLSATSVSTVQAVGFYDVLAKAEPAERAVLQAAIERAHPTVSVVQSDQLPPPATSAARRSVMFDGLVKAMPDLARKAVLIRGENSGQQNDAIAISLGEGRSLVFDPEVGNQRVNFPRLVVPLFISILVLPLAVLALWGLKMLTAPLRQLAMSAERFSIDLDPTPHLANGPAEIVKLAHAFNTMKGRIRQLVDSRSRMLAAVSHDLRTPLTRIRLRAESLPENDDRERMLKDVVTMDRMIGQALSYLRDQASPTTRERVNLHTLLESICDDFNDMGRQASFSGPRNVVLECEPDLLTRAISNIVDNAIKFGGRAAVTMEMRSPSEVTVRVEDVGPGIPDDRKFMAFEPFSRGDQARGAPETEGFGLGLAIAKQIIERHGGQITLHDREPTGLSVQIVLPVSNAPARQEDRAAQDWASTAVRSTLEAK
jgi:signal transduction histidine kinase